MVGKKIEMEIEEIDVERLAEKLAILVIPKLNSSDIWMTPEEAGKYSRMSRNWIYEQTSKGFLPFTKTGGKGGKTLIKKSDLDQYLNSLSVPAYNNPSLLTIPDKTSKTKRK